jgi:hypothetical protein
VSAIIKAAAVYWIIGCLLAGLGVGGAMQCHPSKDISNADILTFFIAWPMSGTFRLAYHRSVQACEP